MRVYLLLLVPRVLHISGVVKAVVVSDRDYSKICARCYCFYKYCCAATSAAVVVLEFRYVVEMVLTCE